MMRLGKYISILLVTTAIASPARADIGLMNVLNVALKHDPLLNSVDHQRQATKGDKREACGRLYPQLSGEAGYVYYEQDKEGTVLGDSSATTLGEVDGSQATLGLSVTQSLFDLPRYSECRAWDKRLKQGSTEYEIALEELISRVITAYVDVLSAKNDLKTAEAKVKLYKNLMQDARQGLSAKTETQQKVDNLQAELELANAELVNAHSQLMVGKMILQSFYTEMVDVDAIRSLRERIVIEPIEPNDPNHWADIAEQSNLRLLRQRYSQEALEYEMKASRYEYLPTVDVYAGHTYRNSDLDRAGVALTSDNDDFSTDVVAVRMNWRFYTGGSRTGAYSASKHRLYAANEQKELERQNVRIEATRSSLQLQTLQAQLEASRASLVAAKSNLKAIKSGVRAGTSRTSQLLDAQLARIEADAKLNAAYYSYAKGLAEFWQTIGALSVASVESLDQWLVPTSSASHSDSSS